MVRKREKSSEILYNFLNNENKGLDGKNYVNYMQEAVQFATLRSLYFRKAETHIKLIALIASAIVICSLPPWNDWVHHIAALAVLFGWTELTRLLGHFPDFMSSASSSCLWKKKNAFVTPWSSIPRTFAMMLGDFEYDDYFKEGN